MLYQLALLLYVITNHLIRQSLILPQAMKLN